MYDLIIFDCDGTLVNTEDLSNKVHSQNLINLGLHQYIPQRCLEEFTGSSWSNIKSKIESENNITVPDSLLDDYVHKMLQYVETENIEISGSLDFVKTSALNAKITVASNGTRVNVIKSLKVSGFMDYFEEDNICAKEQVENTKPAPDIYLLAAKKMNVEPSRCLVIEDSSTGATAGVAAGMDVFGFTGTAHDENTQKQKLLDVGAKAVYSDFIHMAQALGY